MVLTKQQAMDALPASDEAGAAIRAFYDALLRYYPAEDAVDAALDVLVRGVAFLRAAKAAAAAPNPLTRYRSNDQSFNHQSPVTLSDKRP